MSISLGRWMDLQMIILLRDQWYKHPKFATDSVFDRKPERLNTILSKRSKPLNFFRVVLKKLLSTGQALNELENGPSSYWPKKIYFESNRVGFYE